MGHCDGPSQLGDGFFRERLGFLVDAGRIEANAPRAALREYNTWVSLGLVSTGEGSQIQTKNCAN
jgi:hypothetical protein